MTAGEVLKSVASLPPSDWMKIQSGIAEMFASAFSDAEVAEIQLALSEADAEIEAGKGLSSSEMHRHFGLR